MKNLINQFSNLSVVNKVLFTLVIILLIALAAVLYWQRGFEKSYSAVYLSTGDLYFGKVSWFPRLTISETYVLQRDPNNQQNPYSLSPFSNAFWGPEGEISLSSDKVIWIVPLRSDSQVVAYIKAQAARVNTSGYAPATGREQQQLQPNASAPINVAPVATGSLPQ